MRRIQTLHTNVRIFDGHPGTFTGAMLISGGPMETLKLLPIKPEEVASTQLIKLNIR